MQLPVPSAALTASNLEENTLGLLTFIAQMEIIDIFSLLQEIKEDDVFKEFIKAQFYYTIVFLCKLTKSSL